MFGGKRRIAVGIGIIYIILRIRAAVNIDNRLRYRARPCLGYMIALHESACPYLEVYLQLTPLDGLGGIVVAEHIDRRIVVIGDVYIQSQLDFIILLSRVIRLLLYGSAFNNAVRKYIDIAELKLFDVVGQSRRNFSPAQRIVRNGAAGPYLLRFTEVAALLPFRAH